MTLSTLGLAHPFYPAVASIAGLSTSFTTSKHFEITMHLPNPCGHLFRGKGHQYARQPETALTSAA